MNKLIARIGQGLVVGVATAALATLVSVPPAHAADHFPVDNDHVVVGQSTVNSFRAFDGNMESWHDGTNVRGSLKGTFLGRGYLRTTFFFHDGTSNVQLVYDGGVQQTLAVDSPAGRTVVRFTVRYEPNSGSVDTWTGYVGDYPQSLGNCTQLDDDETNVAQSGFGTFFGHVTYGCASNGHIVAHVRGTLNWDSAAVGAQRVIAVVTYATGAIGGSQNLCDVTQNGAHTCSVAIDSDASRNVRSVKVVVIRDSTQNGPSATSKFGDA